MLPGDYIVFAFLTIIGVWAVMPFAPYIAKFVRDSYWRLAAGATVFLPWPETRWIEIGDGVSRETNDPHDHYRPWLEENVGKRGWAWTWSPWYCVDTNDVSAKMMIKLTVRRGKESYASAAALKWSS